MQRYIKSYSYANIYKTIFIIQHTHGLSDRNHRIISIDSEEEFDKDQPLTVVKALKTRE